MQKRLRHIRHNALAQDSFWAVVGNGVANGLFLLAGIVIARLIGKDLYGEYGVVKTTMFYSAMFATFGLGFTSTKYIAEYIQTRQRHAQAIIRDALQITALFSITLAILLFIFSPHLAIFLHEEELSFVLRVLSCVIIFKALSTTQQGILSGLHAFKALGINNIISGSVMLLATIPLAYFFSLMGALLSLLLSQILLCILNYISIRQRPLDDQDMSVSFKAELLRFSFPIALQESTFAICNWLGLMLLARYSSVGDVGIFTACQQWNIVIMLIPNLLTNVVLTHLAGTAHHVEEHHTTMHRMLIINVVCSIIPFAIVYPLSSFISSFYGESFTGMIPVMHILLFDALIYSISSVFKSELIATGHNWLLFFIRLTKDVLLVGLAYLLLTHYTGLSNAENYAIAFICSSVTFFILSVGTYLILSHHHLIGSHD